MSKKEVRNATLVESLIPISFMAIFLSFCIFKYGASPHIPLIVTTIIASLIAVFRLGYSWEVIEQGMFETIISAMQAILITILIGILIGVWIVSGVVPCMIYWGLKIISPNIFLVASLLACAIISISTGSSWSTIGTIGVALLGIAQSLEIPVGLAAGAIISGAYFGDKLSPLSETTNLAPAVSGTDLFSHIKYMTYSTIPSLIICIIIYGVIGLRYSGRNLDIENILLVQETLKLTFNTLSPVLLIAPIFVISLVIFKIPAIPGLVGGILIGVLFAVTLQGVDLGSVLSAAQNGYVAKTGVQAVEELLSKGGLSSMMSTISLILCALSLGGVLEKTGMLKSIAEVLLKRAKGVFGTVACTMLTCLFTNIIAGEQYLAIVIPGKMYKSEFEKKGLDPVMLSRALEDSGTLTSVLVPWTSCGAYVAGVLGVSAFTYAPFTFLNIINPFVSLIMIAFGIKIVRTNSNKEEIV
ncbi:Na+/H+ antiporter NhaC [Intestinibacter bartlettii]|uniref:Na+/H+ antiporter NhaC n=1 Tax=Intestinibacter bartlettii TaxID=261299 RepID=UPI001D006029|nr:Na+/H+ antiporter NhaC [Intestinibacter bartlettii]MCB5397090.1 Na+/H+ antiporter NhaC [Intestinibacter bartlettii]MCB5403639.1 Na+/H+ antiporter NhaC [Intestinibacter bartlettii]